MKRVHLFLASEISFFFNMLFIHHVFYTWLFIMFVIVNDFLKKRWGLARTTVWSWKQESWDLRYNNIHWLVLENWSHWFKLDSIKIWLPKCICIKDLHKPSLYKNPGWQELLTASKSRVYIKGFQRHGDLEVS